MGINILKHLINGIRKSCKKQRLLQKKTS